MKFCFIGEAMIELANSNAGCQLGFAGDTLNTAIHLARFGHEVAYFTAIGQDDYSKDFIEFLKSENIDTSFVYRHPSRHMGLYSIRTDEDGERSFQYWRDNSAAKAMFAGADIGEIAEHLSRFDYVCFSLISLAILPGHDRTSMIDLFKKLRSQGVQIVFDGNYRPRLWDSAATAAIARDTAISICDIGLPTFDDEVAISNFADIGECLNHWQNMGAGEVLIKDGINGCLTNNFQRIAPEKRLHPIDTSGAGDAFNSGYLNGRANGLPPEESANIGNKLAGWVIMNRGAIPTKGPNAPY